jgi:hypothetical protein
VLENHGLMLFTLFEVHFLILWPCFRRKIVRPQLGLKLRTVNFLGMSHIEQLSRNFNISSGLIVGEVY